MQEAYDVVTLDSLTLEALGPGGEGGAGQAVLAAGEREGEAQWQLATHQIVFFDKAEDAVCYMVKQLKQNTNNFSSL